MQKKSNPFDLVNIISVVLGIVMIAVFIVWGNKRLEGVATPAAQAAAGSTAGATTGAPAVGGMTSPGGTSVPTSMPASSGPLTPTGSSFGLPPGSGK